MALLMGFSGGIQGLRLGKKLSGSSLEEPSATCVAALTPSKHSGTVVACGSGMAGKFSEPSTR